MEVTLIPFAHATCLQHLSNNEKHLWCRLPFQKILRMYLVHLQKIYVSGTGHPVVARNPVFSTLIDSVKSGLNAMYVMKILTVSYAIIHKLL